MPFRFPATNDAGVFAWAMCIYLILCSCIVPGFIFWFIFIRPERFDLILCDVHGATDHVLFRTTTWDEADEIMAVIKEATGLANQSELGKTHLDAPPPPDNPRPDRRPAPRTGRDEDDFVPGDR